MHVGKSSELCALAGLLEPSMLDRQSLRGPVGESDETDVDRLVADLGDHELALEDVALAGVPDFLAVAEDGDALAHRTEAAEVGPGEGGGLGFRRLRRGGRLL